MKKLSSLLLALFAAIAFAADFNPNDFKGSDSQRINAAIRAAVASGGKAVITARKADAASKRTFWLLEEALLLPGNSTVILENCTLKLADSCRDNFFRSANCIVGSEPDIISNITIKGVGKVELIGADIPRATGDSGKLLGTRTFGTDSGRKGENPKGDWRNIGILLVKVDNFAIENITIRDSHCWAISLEQCRFGKIRDIHFESKGWKMINGKKETILNQDGLDLRRGCNNILIENITGFTGDDLIALTAIAAAPRIPAYTGTQFIGGCNVQEHNDIAFVTIRNVRGYCAGGHHIVRLLNGKGSKIHHIFIDNVMDNSPADFHCRATIKIGDVNRAWSAGHKLGDTAMIQISNIWCNTRYGILLQGTLADSTICNVINRNPNGNAIHLHTDASHRRNVRMQNIFFNPDNVL